MIVKNGDERQDVSNDDGDNRVDISVDDGRRGYRYQETIHSYSNNHGETVDGDLRCGYRSHTSHSSSHNPCDHGRLLCLSIAYRIVHENINYK